MMDALDAGAEDFSPDGPVFEITTDPDSFNDVVKALEAKGYTFASAELEMVPQTYVTMTGEDDVKNMNKLIDMLEDNEERPLHKKAGGAQLQFGAACFCAFHILCVPHRKRLRSICIRRKVTFWEITSVTPIESSMIAMLHCVYTRTEKEHNGENRNG